jgi:hypothetical protein
MKTIKSVQSEQVFKEVDALFTEVFQEIHYSATSWAWWRAFNNGCTVLQKDGEVIGSLMAFPMTKNSIIPFWEGKTGENDLEVDPKHRSFWYISDMVIKSGHRTMSNFRRLLWASLDKWVENAKGQPYPMQIFATASSPQGIKICEVSYMTKYCETGIDGLPIYYKQFNTKREMRLGIAKIKISLIVYPAFRQLKKIFTL